MRPLGDPESLCRRGAPERQRRASDSSPTSRPRRASGPIAVPRGRPGGRRFSRLPTLVALLIASAVALPAPAQAQRFDGDGIRLGVGVAGTGLVSLLVEYRRNNTSVDMAISTIAFRDVGLYAGVRQYLGQASPQPVLGLGLWGLVAGEEERTGGALILRAPIGLDIDVSGEHAVGFNIALNRALLVRRPDPADTEPPNPRLVPIPALEYRYWNR